MNTVNTLNASPIVPKFSPGWLTAMGVLMIFFGILALSSPLLATLGVTTAFAAILVVNGAFQFVHAIQVRNHQNITSPILLAILSIVAGIATFVYPVDGMIGITLLLAAYFLVSASSRWRLSSLLPEGGTRTWSRTSAVISFFLGIYLIVTLPFAAYTFPGVILGVELIFMGSFFLSFSAHARKGTINPLTLDRIKSAA
jgi:uncharacterized membrane protein HdeD (DUF308 family)